MKEPLLQIILDNDKLKKKEPEERKELNNDFWDKDHLLSFNADTATNYSSQTSKDTVMKSGNINNVIYILSGAVMLRCYVAWEVV